jgi:3-deoxy-D-manno-octulosonic-acid transferase
MGVLTDWYRAADVAVVGGTFAPYGGHNPMEPAACGAAVIVGPYHGSQREGVRVLEAAGAIWRVSDGHGLVAALEGLLSRHDLRLARSAAGVRVASAERGSAQRAVDRLTEWGLWPVR